MIKVVETNDKKIPLIIFGISIFIIILSLVGFAYAFFTASIDGNSNNSLLVTTADLSVTYNSGDGVSGTNITPGWTQNKTFSVKNNSSTNVLYELYWTNITNNFFDPADLVYTLTCSSDEPLNNPCTGKSETTFPSSDATILAAINIDPGELQTYSITVTYINQSHNQLSNMGSSFAGKIALKD